MAIRVVRESSSLTRFFEVIAVKVAEFFRSASAFRISNSLVLCRSVSNVRALTKLMFNFLRGNPSFPAAAVRQQIRRLKNLIWFSFLSAY